MLATRDDPLPSQSPGKREPPATPTAGEGGSSKKPRGPDPPRLKGWTLEDDVVVFVDPARPVSDSDRRALEERLGRSRSEVGAPWVGCRVQGVGSGVWGVG